MHFQKSLLFLLLIFLCSAGYCYENDSIKRKKAVGFAVGGDLCYRALGTEADIYSIAGSYALWRNVFETRKFGFSAEFTLVQPVGKRFNVLTGIYFREKGFLRPSSSWTDTAGVSNIGMADVSYQMSFIGIPIKFEYVQPFKHFSFFVNGGIGLDFMVRNQIKAKIDYYWLPDATEKFKRGERTVPWHPNIFEMDANRLTLTGLLEFGVEIPLSDLASLRIAPNGSYGLGSILKTPISEKLWSFGVNMGMRFNF